MATHVKQKGTPGSCHLANRESDSLVGLSLMKYVFHFLIVGFFIHFLSTHSTVGPAVNHFINDLNHLIPTATPFSRSGPDLFQPVCTAMIVPVWGKLRRGKLTSFLLGYLVLVQFSQNYHNTHQEKHADLEVEDSIFSFLSIFSVEGKIIKEKTMDPTTRLRHLVAPGGLEPCLVSYLCTQVQLRMVS